MACFSCYKTSYYVTHTILLSQIFLQTALIFALISVVID